MSPPPDLSLDIQVEIIKRLPVKSLIQFRSVCKAWKSLIDSSHFIAGYNFRHHQSEHLLVIYEVRASDFIGFEVKYVSIVDDDTFPQQKFDLTVPPLFELTPTVIGSSHGLLCFYCCYFEGGRQDVAVLWNPSIKKSIAVVVPNMLDAPFSSVLGFGVCPANNDPKLVRITYINAWWEPGRSRSHIPGQVMVYSVNSKEWKYPCNNLPRKSIQFKENQTVAVGKFIYWVAYDRRFAKDGTFRDHNLIISFDMGTEEFREVNLPDSLTHFPFECFFISRLRESLALLEYTHEDCIVWMMDHGDPKLFTKLYTIKSPHAGSTLTSLWFRKSGQPIGAIHDDVDNIPCALVVYEPCLEHVKEIFENIFGVRSVDSYTESLLLLDHDDGHVVRCGDVKG